MVSPLDKNGGDIRALPPFAGALFAAHKQSSLDGERVTYTSSTAFGDAVAGPWSSQYISSRGPTGWSTHGISPPRGTAVFEGKTVPPTNWDTESLFEAFTPDLCNSWVRDTNLIPLTPDGLQGYVNLYRRFNCGVEAYEALSREGPFGLATEYLNDDAGGGPGLRFQGASSDLNHQVFIAGAQLLPDEVGFEASCTTTTTADAISYQWLRNAIPIEGATSPTYTMTGADQGAAIQCQVFATNAGATSTQVANPARVVAPPADTLPAVAPTAIAAPAQSESLAVGGPGGQTLTCDPKEKEWSGSPSFSYRWYRNGVAIAEATASTYTVSKADLAAPAVFQCAVIATNLGGVVVKVSNNRATAPNPGAPVANASTWSKKTRLYDLHNGQLELVSVLPDGRPNPENSVAGTLGNPDVTRQSSLEHAVSEDGSRIFWTSTSGSDGGGPGHIYVRIDGEVTLPVSGADARYWTAAADGSAVLYTIEERLFEFNVNKALDEGVAAAKRPIAESVPGLLGASDDLSRIYFVSEEVLDDGASIGEWNLYLEEEGAIRFIATFSGDDRDAHIAGISPIRFDPIRRTSRVTADGRHIAFQALGSLTGFDNVDPTSGKRFTEVFRYDANSDELICVSCNLSGDPPSGPPIRIPYNAFNEVFMGESFPERFGEAATLPTWEREQYASRVLSENGNRLFFHSHEALVPRDTNGVRDVYQWEAHGTGSCEEVKGCVSLISTGTSPQASEFVDASADGGDVFFSTTSSIDPRDEGSIDIYDARVGGGFSIAPPRPDCLGDACQSVPAAPSDSTPAGAIFRGPGDPLLPSRCKALGRRAARLARRASRSDSPRLSKRAKRIGKRARRCRRANHGGSK